MTKFNEQVFDNFITKSKQKEIKKYSCFPDKYLKKTNLQTNKAFHDQISGQDPVQKHVIIISQPNIMCPWGINSNNAFNT